MTHDRLYNSVTQTTVFQPARLVQAEMNAPLADLTAVDPETGQHYQRAIVLVRLHNQPVGIMELSLPEAGLSATAFSEQVWQKFGTELRQRQLQTEDDALGTTLPPISIVIATHNRTDSLAICLRSLLALDYPTYEIIVVDNAPSSDETANFIVDAYGNHPQVRYVREEVAGLAVAHNRGLLEVRYPYVAFTDDDVVVDPHWLTALASGFAAATHVGCVTGMIFPMELETEAQMMIEQYGGFNKGFSRRIFDLGLYRPESPLFPYAAGCFGSGANMAFKTAVLQEMGGFDPALGAGSKGVGGDDLAAFFDVVSSGYQLVYEPAAIVHHRHYREHSSLQKQMYGYGVGLTAFLTKTIVDRPTRIFEILWRLPRGLYYAFSANSAKNQGKGQAYPAELSRLERKGMAYGPVAYLRSYLNVRKRQQEMTGLPQFVLVGLGLTKLAGKER
jgi:GT2 family glycosyltransferase